MRNNERQKVLFGSITKPDISLPLLLSVFLEKVQIRTLITPLWGLLFAAFFLGVATASPDFSNVDQALPALVSEGESLPESQQWYRAHSNQDSYTSTFSADGRLLALTSHNNPVELWDTETRAPISTFQGGGLSESDAFVDISPDGKFIAINVGERIEIRRIETKSLEFSVPSISGGAATFSPDSRLFATAIDGKRLDLWEVETKKRIASFIQHTETISALGFSPGGRYLVSADISGMFSVWDTDSKELLYQYTEHKAPVTTVQFSDKDDRFISIDTDGAVMLWDAAANKRLHRYSTPRVKNYEKSSAAFSPDGKTFVVSLNKPGDKNYLLLFSTLIGGRPLFSYENNDHEINDIAFRPDGNSLVVSLSSKTIKIFDIPGRQYVDTFGGQILKATKTRVSPDGALIATGTVDGHIQLWDAHKKMLKYSLKGRNHSIEYISFSPDGTYIVVGDNHGAVTVWERNTNNRVFFIKAHKLGAAMAVMSPDNQYLATASTKSSIVKLWDVQSNTPTFKFIGHHGDITDIAYSPDGKFIASASKDGTIKLWNTRNKSLEQSLIGNEKVVGFLSLAFSPDGRFLAAGTDQGSADHHFIEIWDIHDKKHLRTLKTHDAPITAIRFSKKGEQLVSASKDGTIKVWEVATGEPIHSITTNTKKEPVHSVDFTEDGSNILSVSHNGSTELWNLKAQKKAYTLIDGPRGTWVSENHLQKKFFRGDDGSLIIKKGDNLPPAPLAPKGLASEDKLILTASRERVKVAKEGGRFSITIKNIGETPSFWLRARQIHGSEASVTLLSDKLTRLNSGQRGVLNLQLIPHDFSKLARARQLNLEMEVVTKAGSRFPIVIPLEFQDDIGAGRNKTGRY